MKDQEKIASPILIGFQVEAWSHEALDEYALSSGMIFVGTTFIIAIFKFIQEYKKKEAMRKAEESFWLDDSFIDPEEFNKQREKRCNESLK